MLREITNADYMDYLSLLKQLNKMDINMTIETFNLKYQLIKINGGTIYVYEQNDVIIASVKILKEIKFADDVVHIEDVIVDSRMRKQGIGKKMMKEVMTLIPECYKAVLGCNIDLFEFYVSCGFILEGHIFTKRLK